MNAWVDWRFSGSRDYPLFTKFTDTVGGCKSLRWMYLTFHREVVLQVYLRRPLNWILLTIVLAQKKKEKKATAYRTNEIKDLFKKYI